MIYKCIYIDDINSESREELSIYIENNISSFYHLIEFQNVIVNSFGYENISLVVLNEHNSIVGYVPQFIKSNIIESIPWRDRGGPLYDNDEVLELLINTTKRIVNDKKLKGFLWKDFYCKQLGFYEYYIVVTLDLENKSDEILWKSIKNRRNINQANKNNLTYTIEPNSKKTIDRFYKLFTHTRKRLGVPTYDKNFFYNIIKYMNNGILIASVKDSDNKDLALIIIFYTNDIAIYAYGSSSMDANKNKANEFLMWNTILHFNSVGINTFDFGADSPLQESLIRYKMKWGAKKRIMKTSYYGNVYELDHNSTKFNLLKKIIRNMPMWLYIIFSKMVVR